MDIISKDFLDDINEGRACVLRGGLGGLAVVKSAVTDAATRVWARPEYPLVNDQVVFMCLSQVRP